MFDESIILITGGTGSFGNAVLDKLLSSDVKEIRIFSRDEKKQDDMRKKYKNPKLKFYIGDVRDFKSVNLAMSGVNYCFHSAALKQVPSCEFYPMEAVKTNVIGTSNVIESAIDNKVKKIVCLSTDKAVYPVNAMGITKALMEKVMISSTRRVLDSETILCCTRYGNVLASRGSVVPLFLSQIKNSKPLTITDPNMTRFMMTLDDAVSLVLYAFENACNGDIFVKKSSSVSMEILAKALLKVIGKPNHPINTIGTRHGEKLFESLLSREELARASSHKSFYRVPADLRDLNYDKYYTEGEIDISNNNDYNSNNSYRLNENEMEEMLKSLPIIQNYLTNNSFD